MQIVFIAFRCFESFRREHVNVSGCDFSFDSCNEAVDETLFLHLLHVGTEGVIGFSGFF
jgi:hypothetical protein